MYKIDTPVMAPYCCKSCSGIEKDWYIDTGTSEEYWGAVYYCNECFTAWANDVGLVDGKKLRAQLKKQNEELILLREKAVFLDALFELVRSSGFALHNFPADPVLDALSAREAEGGVVEGEESSPEQSSSEGLPDAPSDGIFSFTNVRI